MSEAWAVVDLGFGDAGKGVATDFLTRERHADLVVRFHGGAQAGHNVIAPDGRHHTFSQFGAGMFAGARGLLGPDFLLHPLGMWVEAEHLARLGFTDPWEWVEVDPRARVITPYQQAAGRARERLRGTAAHGTCGVGVGECVADDLAHPDETLRAADLGDRRAVQRALIRQRERKRAELHGLGAGSLPELELFDDPELIGRVIDAWAGVADRLRLAEASARIAASRRVVFEGAQGVLLDEIWGFHPHTTWSDCTPAGARRLAGDRPLTVIGVVRAYGVRHGAGPFPTEGALALDEAHNDSAGWQGRFRTGALDGVLLRYAVEVCGGVDGLAVSCLDRVPHGPTCDAYVGAGPADLTRGDPVRALIPGDPADLGHRERLGRWLGQVTPVLAQGEPARFAASASGVPVVMEGRGPRASDWRWTDVRRS